MLKLKEKLGYKLIYLDTNAVSDITKKHLNAGKNILSEFFYNNTDKYAFVTSVYNIKELSKENKHKGNVKEIFDKIPLLIVDSFPSILDKDYNNEELGLFAIGTKPMFNVNISDLFEMIASQEFQETLKILDKHLNMEIMIWNKERRENKTEQELFNSSYKIYNNYNNNKKLVYGTKGGKIFAYIKDHFIYKQDKPIDKNSIIDTYNATISPYIDVFIGEKSVTSWLEFAKKDKFDFMKNIEIKKISKYY